MYVLVSLSKCRKFWQDLCPGEQDILCMEMQLDVLMQRSNPDGVGAKAIKNICKFPFPALLTEATLGQPGERQNFAG